MNLKSTLFSILIVFLWTVNLPAQTSFGCYTDNLRAQELKANPGLEQEIERRDAQIRQNLNSKVRTIQKSGQNIIIPVLVHVIHNNGPENISDQQVISQITALNNAFSSHGVQFCLAEERNGYPIGNPNGSVSNTPGILHLASNYTVHAPGSADEMSMKLLVPNYDPSRYLKVWVVDSIISFPGSTIGGYSRLPGSFSPVLDGVVVRADAFGEITACGTGCHLSQSNEDGDVMVHEVGHYLGLYHTFEGSCSGMTSSNCDISGDQVCDTPPVAAPNSGCPTSVNSCNESPDLPDLLNNYMDYTNESCRAAFTNGQANRMLTTISLYRSGLSTPQNHVYTGINCSAGLGAFFSASRYTACLNENITFEALYQAGATYRWNFDGTTVYGQTVTQSFSTAYDPLNVELTVFLNGDSAKTSIPFFIKNCTPITDPNSTWFFGKEDGVDFSSGVPVYDNSARSNGSINTNESSAVQGDANGNLLFFTDGRYVYDGNHNLVNTNPNDTMSGHSSAQRGTLIIPDPANNNEYYIFYTYSAWSNNNISPNARGFSYSKVSVAGNGTVTMLPNINSFVPIPTGLGLSTLPGGGLASGEGITAIENCNGYWLFCTADSASKKFLLTYQVSPSGISYVSSTDVMLTGSNSSSGGAVNICASPDGNKIAVSSISYYYGEQIGLRAFQFNKHTGMVGTLLLEENFDGMTSTHYKGYYGLSFSPNSKYLYANGGGSQTEIAQYNVESPNPLYTFNDIGQRYKSGPGQMQLGPDGKIYITGYGRKRLAVIHKPNEAGINSMFVDYGPTKPPFAGGYLGALPNVIDATSSSVFDNTISTVQVNCTEFNFQPNFCGNSFSWNFGDPASGINNTTAGSMVSHVFSGPGTYTVIVTNNFGVSISETVIVNPAPVPNIAGELCDDNPGQLMNYSTTTNGDSYQWTANGGTIVGLSTNSNVDVVWSSFPATLTLEVTDENGCTGTTTVTITDCSSACPCELNPQFGYSVGNCSISLSGISHIPACNVEHTWIIQGAPTTFSGSTLNYTFSTSGSYSICHIVESLDSVGQVVCADTLCEIIDIECDNNCDECDLSPRIDYETEDRCFFRFYGINAGSDCPTQVYEWTVYNTNNTLLYTFAGQDFDYQFPASGTYIVCLEIYVRDNNGNVICKKMECIEVDADCEPCDGECELAPGIKVETEDYCKFGILGFNEGEDCPTQIYEWSVFDNNGVLVHSSVGRDIDDYTFTAGGSYVICLEIYVIDYNGQKICKRTTCIKIDVRQVGCTIESIPYNRLKSSNNDVELNSLSIHPNPNVKGGTFSFEGIDWSEVSKITVYGSRGETIKEFTPNSNTFVIDELVNSGLYLIRFDVNQKVVIKKIIIE